MFVTTLEGVLAGIGLYTVICWTIRLTRIWSASK